jgi:hypothetical protein
MPYKDPAVAKARSDLYRKENREKLRAAAKRRHVDNRDEHLAYLKEYRKNNLEARIDCDLRRVYGITLDEYKLLLQSQGGVCAICSVAPERIRLSVDHDHETGKVRGLLCHKCNLGLGYFQDSVSVLDGAASYLVKHGKRWNVTARG